MYSSITFRHSRAAAALCVAALPPLNALACSSCACTLSSDWSSQGLRSGPGLSVDLRHDYSDQNDLRSGTGRVDVGGISLPAEVELQRSTVNRISTLTLDYGINEDWALALQLPFVHRYHASIIDGDTEVSTSRSSSIGDVRVLVRYQGFAAERDWGLQFGLKLASGGTDVRFGEGPQAGEPLDRGLQPGTGSTDLLLGLYRFGSITPNLDYFAQATLQVPIATKDEFKPGLGANLSAGIRYVGSGSLVPQLQINLRTEGKESGANADVDNSGATLVYLSPGATLALGEKLKAYGFLQLPVYQRVTGLQLEPKYSVSIGLHYAY